MLVNDKLASFLKKKIDVNINITSLTLVLLWKLMLTNSIFKNLIASTPYFTHVCCVSLSLSQTSVARVILSVATPPFTVHNIQLLRLRLGLWCRSRGQSHCHCRYRYRGKLLLHIIRLYCICFKWNGFLHGLCVFILCVKQN